MSSKTNWYPKDWMKVEPYLPQEPTDLLENIFVEHSKAESKLLSQVLARHIGKEPTTEDWGKCQKIHDTMESFKFIYNGYYLGRFVRKIKNEFDKNAYSVVLTFSFESR